MNNKGVTLIELLIVIVVIGIISAFAVPAVGQFLENAQKSAVLQDAIAVRNAAENYCGYTGTCAADETLSYNDLDTYLTSFSSGDYLQTDGTDNDVTLATRTATGWQVVLEAGTAAAGEGDWEYVSTTDPIEATAETDVTED